MYIIECLSVLYIIEYLSTLFISVKHAQLFHSCVQLLLLVVFHKCFHLTTSGDTSKLFWLLYWNSQKKTCFWSFVIVMETITISDKASTMLWQNNPQKLLPFRHSLSINSQNFNCSIFAAIQNCLVECKRRLPLTYFLC